MQTYIINPMWFYWLQVVGGAKFFFEFLTLVSVIFVLILGATWWFCKDIYNSYPSFSEKEHKTYMAIQKVFKPIIVVSIFIWLASIFIPSKETLISIMVAKFATYENAQWTADAIKSTVDYVIEAFKTIG